MQQPIRVLHVLGGLALGGAESRIMDLYRNIDRDKIQFDFMVHNQSEDHYNQEIRALGGHIYRVPRFKLYNIIAYRRAWKLFFQEHQEFQVIHGHMTSTAGLYLPIAKRAGVPMTIAHARSAGTDPGLKGIVTRILRSTLTKKADYCIACSREAAIAVFGKKAMELGQVEIIPNAIPIDKYRFNKEARDRMRKQYRLEDKVVIGHVGRFHYAKNHEFLIKVFHEIMEKEPRAMLVLLGEGPLMQEVKDQVCQLSMDDKVLFLGNHTDVENYYQMMDYLIFPSRFEGLPGTIVEAQAAGLQCLVSDAITREVAVTDSVIMKSIQDAPAQWAETMLQTIRMDRTGDISALREKGFDVKQQVLDYTEFYLGNRAKVL